MSFTTDPSTDIGKIRLLIPDLDEERQLFQDEELQALLDMLGHVMLAAAQALDTIAADTAMTQQAVTILGLTTDGPAVAKVLYQRSAQLRRDYSRYGGEAVAFGSAQFADDSLQAAELLTKRLLQTEVP